MSVLAWTEEDDPCIFSLALVQVGKLYIPSMIESVYLAA